MKTTRVIFGVFLLFCLLQWPWSSCLGQESSSSSPSTNFPKESNQEGSEAVVYLLIDYRDPDIGKLSFNELIEQNVTSCFVRHGRYILSETFSIKELFNRALVRQKMDPENFRLMRAQGLVFTSRDGVTFLFSFIPKK